MKFSIYLIFLTVLGFGIFQDVYQAVAFGLTLSIAVQIILRSNDSFVFREWALLLYAVNYLLSPAVTYNLSSIKITNYMKIPSESYFTLAVPGFLLFAFGMFLLPTQIFKPNFNKISKSTSINEQFLVQMTIFCILCNLVSGIFSAEFAFFIYLLSSVRFVGVFALFALNQRKYRWLLLVLLGYEVLEAFRIAMFHDVIMWVIFFGLFYLYLLKPNLTIKIIGAATLISFVLLIQAFKGDYRERVWRGGEEASIETIGDVGLGKANSADLAGEDNLLGTLNRGNQAWIFSSTVDNMDRTMDFQGMNNVNRYLESALLPRFLAPNKISAGDKLIFNRFSGHHISGGTSMGLGVFADGYIAYGNWGVYFFTFILGLLFSLTFKLIERWSKISPFYILFVLPMLNYAVRPDCELQTVVNHLAKSIMLFGGLVYLTKYRFSIDPLNFNKK